jgi:hypothetical protein
MARALTPTDALEYLRQLSADVRAGAVLNAAGEVLADPDGIAAHARELLAATDAAELEVTLPNGVVFTARDDRHAVVVATGSQVLPGLQRHDLRTVLGDLR